MGKGSEIEEISGGLDEMERREADSARLGEDVDMRKDLLAWAAKADALGFRSGSGGIAFAESVPDEVKTELFAFASAVLDIMGGYTDKEIAKFEADSDPKSEDDKGEIAFMREHGRSKFVQAVENTRTALITALNEAGYDRVWFSGLEEMRTRDYSERDTVDVRFSPEKGSGLPDGGWVSIAKSVIAVRNAMMPRPHDDFAKLVGGDDDDDDDDDGNDSGDSDDEG